MMIYTVYPRGFGANSYILTSDNKTAIVIDPAQPRVQAKLNELGLKAEYVLLTHCHFDHVGGVAELVKSGAKVLCTEAEKPLFHTPADLFEAFGAPRIPFSIDETLQDDEERILCGMRVKTLLTAGHTQGSACYLFYEKDGGRYLFTGDTLFQGTIGRTDFPTGNIGQLRQSLRRLKALDGDMPIYAGHEEHTTLDEERKHNPFMAD